MSHPNPYDLFLNAWSHALADEESARPGTEEWENSRERLHAHWTRVWMDCERLSSYIESYKTICEKIKPRNIEDEEQEEKPA
jgi:hypothetical protein